MPQIDFEEDVPGSFKSQFTQLSAKGERIKFRIVDKPFYVGKHWIGDKQVVNCPRINSGDKEAHCEYCEKFEEGIENPDHMSKSFKPSMQFYYPIINRQTHEAQIFQTSLSVHLAIKEAADAGIDVYKSDWQVTRNEGSPANYYGVVRLDPTPLTEDEKKEVEQVKEIVEKLKSTWEGKASSITPPKEEEEEVDLSDLPFS